MGLFGGNKCPGCSRYRGACICHAATKAEVKKAKAAGKPDPSPHRCPKIGCSGTVRGGVCPDPRGVH